MVPLQLEQRQAVRQRYQREVPFRLGRELGTAQVRDLSHQGIGLLSPHAIPAGSILTVELPNQAQTFWQLKLVRVAHATPQPENGWLIGSRFCRALTEDELLRVLS